jgi:hypothetical protein
MAKVKEEESVKIKALLEKKVKENFIIKQVESVKIKGGFKKKHSLFMEEMDMDWDDFLARRAAELPPLPKIEHHGHGHGHHSGPIDHDKIRKHFTIFKIY